MRRPLIHQLAILTAVLAWISIATGAVVTSENLPEGRQFSLFTAGQHRAPGEAAVALLLVAAGGIFASVQLRRLRGFTGITVILGAAAGFTFRVPILHAFLAPLFFASAVCLALFTSASWEKRPERFGARRFPKLVPLAAVTPFLVTVQIALGAAYRHQALGVMPHLAGAMLVALAVLGLCVFVMQSLPENRALNRTAAVALTVTLIQVTLGIAVFVMGMLDADTTLVALLSAIGHVSTGALVLAASSVFALQIRRAAA